MWLFLVVFSGLSSAAPNNDEQACEEAQRIRSYDAWISYLKRFPAGNCAALPYAVDAKACRYARTENTKYGWTEYQKRHPKGLCINLAKQVLEEGIPFVPNVQMEQPTVLGPLEPQPVLDVLRHAGPELQKCWEGARNDELAGDVVIRFQIKKDGSVKGARVRDSEIEDESVKDCLAEAMTTVVYDPPGANVLVTLPIKLLPR